MVCCSLDTTVRTVCSRHAPRTTHDTASYSHTSHHLCKHWHQHHPTHLSEEAAGICGFLHATLSLEGWPSVLLKWQGHDTLQGIAQCLVPFRTPELVWQWNSILHHNWQRRKENRFTLLYSTYWLHLMHQINQIKCIYCISNGSHRYRGYHNSDSRSIALTSSTYHYRSLPLSPLHSLPSSKHPSHSPLPPMRNPPPSHTQHMHPTTAIHWIPSTFSKSPSWMLKGTERWGLFPLPLPCLQLSSYW